MGDAFFIFSNLLEIYIDIDLELAYNVFNNDERGLTIVKTYSDFSN